MSNMINRPYYRELRAQGYTVSGAYWSVRNFDAFRGRLAAMVKVTDKRAKAAKKGWKTRRANAKNA